MRRRILVAILSVTSIAVVLFGVPLAILVGRFVDEDARLRVERQAVLASRDVPADFRSGTDPVELAKNSDGITFSLYDSNGNRVSGDGPALADAPTLQALGNEVVDAQADGARIVAVPISANEVVVGAIRAQQSTAASDARARRIIALLGALAVTVLVVGAAIGYVVAGRLARPVRRLRDAAVQLGDGDFTIVVPRSSVPELDQAATAMTSTAQRLDDLVSRERSFSADASHQLRTPLAGLRAAIETELDFPRADRSDVLHEALDDVERLERTIDDLLNIARTPRAAPMQVTISEVLTQIGETWHGPLARLGRPLTIADAHDVPPAHGSAATLRHALEVLVDNALRHGAGQVRIDVQTNNETVTISVTDEGPGLRETTPSFAPPTAGDDHGVHGLGLPLARRLVEAMPGRLTLSPPATPMRVDVVLERADTPSGSSRRHEPHR